MTIYQSIINAMQDITAIAKTRKNTSQNYNFRGIDEVYDELHPILAKHGIFSTSKILESSSEDRASKSGGILIYRILKLQFRFYTLDGTYIETEVIGEGMDSGDKAANKAMSVGHKYALLQMFLIPTVDPKDPENESHEIKQKEVPNQKQPTQDEDFRINKLKDARKSGIPQVIALLDGAKNWAKQTEEEKNKFVESVENLWASLATKKELPNF